MQSRRLKSQGFTLVEMLVVVAVTAVLLTVITYPLIASFNITRGAQNDANAQDAIRNLDGKITSEIKQAAGVYDNTGEFGKVAISLPGLDGTVVQTLLPSAKLILAKPAQALDSQNGGIKNDGTGKTDPTLTSGTGQTIFPATAGSDIIMYIVALKDPFRLYNNPYEQFKRGTERWDYSATTRTNWTNQFKGEEASHQTSGEDNMYVLWRVEVSPYVGSGASRTVNNTLFTDLSRVDKTVLTGSTNPADQALLMRANASTGPDLNDPYLLDLSRPAPKYATTVTGDLTQSDPADLSTSVKAQMIRNLLRHATVVTDTNHLDMIMPQIDKGSLKVFFDANTPRAASMVVFRPMHINAEPAAAQLPIANGEETANAGKVGPASYRTQLGNWNDLSLRIYPSHYPVAFATNSVEGAPRTAWETTDSVIDVLPNSTGGTSIYVDGGNEMFNVTTYDLVKAAGQPYAFSQAIVAPGVAANPTTFIPVIPNPATGSVQTSFDVRDFGNIADRISTDTDSDAYNKNIPSSTTTQPGIFTGPQNLVTNPLYTAPGAWTSFNNPNERFACLYNDWDNLFPGGNAPAKDGPQGPKRYIDLRFEPMFGASATFGPLDPRNGVGRAAITPGSEKVYGPDQSPTGTTAGGLVLYQRVPNVDTVTVGPNQYKINYVDLLEPDWTVFGFSSPNYDPLHFDTTFTDFLTVVEQARYRAGYIELDSQVGDPIPAGNIYVTYRFQFTEPKDVVTVSYDSAKSIETVMSVASYGNPTTPIPAITTISGTAEVRNLLR